uniref:thioredoxin-dependent peroxiredoxin n=1 Tax=Moschus moschiferus TaxID=68415 RepID=A0A8C6FJW7_MOSMO
MASGNAHIGKPALEFQAPPEDEGIAYRGLFIIEGKGDPQITHSDLPVGCSVNEALRLVQALQFTEEHEEVCPAGWVPGSHTVKPSVNHNKGTFLQTQPEKKRKNKCQH